MRVMVLIKATKESEAGEMPSEELLSQMLEFNEELGPDEMEIDRIYDGGDETRGAPPMRIRSPRGLY